MRKSLTDILKNGSRDELSAAWNTTEAAGEHEPLPAGEYTCHLTSLDLFNARTNETPGVRMVFKVIEGDCTDRRVWLDCWLTPAALPMTKRDLAKVGISDLSQLEKPLPKGIRCQVKVALRTTDEGDSFNRVRGFTVVGVDEPERDAFAPQDTESEGAGNDNF